MNKFLKSQSLFCQAFFLMVILSVFNLENCIGQPSGSSTQSTPTVQSGYYVDPPYIQDSAKSHVLSIVEAVSLTTNFRNHSASLIQQFPVLHDSLQLGYGESFNGNVFRLLLRQRDYMGNFAAGIRIYYGLQTDGKVTLVMVPYDIHGNDIITNLFGTVQTLGTMSPAVQTAAAVASNSGQVMEDGQRCPTMCPTGSPLTKQ